MIHLFIYTLSSVCLQAVFVMYLSSCERIISDILGRGDQFPIIFGIVAIGFGIAASGKDFGPMLAAEAKAKQAALPESPQEVRPQLAWLAAVPIGALVGVTGYSLWAQGVEAVGSAASLFDIIGASDGYDAMLHGSIASLSLSFLLALTLKALTITEMIEAVINGLKAMVEPVMVLLLAWALGRAVGDLQAANYLINQLGDTIPAWSLPSLIFLLSAAIAFATGTSFGTMAVIIPLAIPLAFAADGHHSLVLATSASVLAGATWGDHCSPISDTTVLASTGSGCDLASHVSTQLPYAFVAGLISLVCCSVPAGFGVNPWLCLLVASLLCLGAIWWLGKRPNTPAQDRRIAT